MANIVRQYNPHGRQEDVQQTLSMPECTKRVGGYIEVHAHGELDLVMDDEGVLKRHDQCLCVDGVVYRGTILVGKFTDAGLEPVPEDAITEFEKHITIRF